MRRSAPAPSPDAYVAALTGWRRGCVAALRSAIRDERSLEEVIKWGNIVYLHGGPVAVIRAEESRVILGFWRGRLLRHIEPRLVPGGKYDMARVVLREGDSIRPEVVARLAEAGAALNDSAGDPTRT